MPDDVFPLWPRRGEEPGDNPALALHRSPHNPNGAAVIVCPGGGYGMLAAHEAEPIAHWLNEHEFQAAILTYRLGPRHRHPAMAQDAQRAMRLLRRHAPRLGIRPSSIGVLGFSAGGHLASTLAVHHNDFHCAADELAGEVSARPDAAVLCYPLIDLAGSITNAGARNNLLGPEPSDELLSLMSTNRHVTADTPPTFLWHCADDKVVPLEHPLRFAEACRRAGVKVEMHVYESGGHGLGLAMQDPVAGTWRDHCIAFLRRHLVDNA